MSEENGFSQNLRQRALRQVIMTTVTGWQSAIIIAMTIFLFGVSQFGFLGMTLSPFGLPAWTWLIFGLIGELLYVGATLTDPKGVEQVVSGMFTERYRPEDIRDIDAQKKLRKALEYYSSMYQIMLHRSGASQIELQNVLAEMDDWIEYMYNMGKQIDVMGENKLIIRDLRDGQRDLKYLENQLKAEKDSSVRQELEQAIDAKKAHLENIQQVVSNIKRFGIKMDNALASMGTIYAQFQLIGSKGIDSSRAKRLQNEIHDQILELQDTLAAIDEVQSHSSY